MNTKFHEKILYKELSYQIQGVAIEVRKNFGSGLKETIYQNAFTEELKARNIKFDKEKPIQIFSPKTGKLIGSYRPDFIVEDKILIELKAVEKIPKMFLDQLFSYLRNSKYELGYFINFASPKLYTKRIILTNDRKPFLWKTRNGTNIKRRNTKLSCLLVSLFVFFGVCGAGQAAELKFEPLSGQAAVGRSFPVKVLLDSGNESINALEIKIRYPEDKLTFGKWSDGNSVVNLWIERPSVKNGAVSFSGIIPGGYEGKSGLLLTLYFRAAQEGEDAISFAESSRALLNDGLGTKSKLKTKNLDFKILAAGSEIKNELQLATSTSQFDIAPPENFKPEVAMNPNIFDGKWFLVFITQDKDSGIDYYAVHESIWKKETTRIDAEDWTMAESPYVLKDQELKSYIYVKATDKAGNFRIAMLPPKNPLDWYEYPLFWVIIIMSLSFAVYSYLKNRRSWRGQHTKIR